MSNVVDLLRFHAVTLDIERPGAQTLSGGYASEASPTQLQFDGVIQPLSPIELHNLPEGQGTLEWRNVWSETEIRIRDRITHGSKVYTVHNLENRMDEGGFYKAQAVRSDD